MRIVSRIAEEFAEPLDDGVAKRVFELVGLDMRLGLGEMQYVMQEDLDHSVFVRKLLGECVSASRKRKLTVFGMCDIALIHELAHALGHGRTAQPEIAGDIDESYTGRRSPRSTRIIALFLQTKNSSEVVLFYGRGALCSHIRTI